MASLTLKEIEQMKNFAAVAVLVFVAVIATGAQTISPLTGEYAKKAESTFTITNNKLQPIVASIEKGAAELTRLKAEKSRVF